jgi:hypothetical protein
MAGPVPTISENMLKVATKNFSKICGNLGTSREPARFMNSPAHSAPTGRYLKGSVIGALFFGQMPFACRISCPARASLWMPDGSD